MSIKFYIKLSNYVTLRFDALPENGSGTVKIYKNEFTELISKGLPYQAELPGRKTMHGSIERLLHKEDYLFLELA